MIELPQDSDAIPLGMPIPSDGPKIERKRLARRQYPIAIPHPAFVGADQAPLSTRPRPACQYRVRQTQRGN